jgi:hypothetical protein
MNCKRADRLLMDSLMGTLSPEDRQDLDAHLVSCARCSEEAAGMESLWLELGDLVEEPLEVPSEKLTRRFRLALADLESAPEVSSRPSFSDWWASLWTVRPAWQAALSAALLLLGVLAGAGLAGGGSSSREIDQLRAEIETMSRVVTVSLLQHQSASERLRAVSWSRMAGGDNRVLTALLDSARSDPNVNVRLAAVDALAGYADQGAVRASLIDTLELEKSPLVQLAVLEAVAPTLLEYFTNQAESL